MLRHAFHPSPKPVRRMKSRKPKKKPTPRMVLEKRADTLVREIILDRDGYCVCPAPEKGHSNIMQCGHLITRGKESVKWDLWNCNVQCSFCNGRHEHYWSYYDDWFLREFGEAQRLRLGADSEKSRKLSEAELETLISELTSIHRRQIDHPNWKPRYTQKQILDGSWRIEYERDVSTSLPDVWGVPNVPSQQGWG